MTASYCILLFILAISDLVQSQEPIFGFNQSTFSGIEQGENYRIPVKFFSGSTQQAFFVTVNLNTASENDINLVTTRLRFLPGTIEQSIEFSLRVDNIAQEFDETFVITLEVPDGTFDTDANIRNRLEGVIIDSDEIEFQLSEEDYTQNEEPNAVLEALITKGSGVALANPVYFRASLLTVDDAITRGVIGEFEDENPVSPNRANYEDFDNTTLLVTFPIDDTVLSRPLTIPIVDDDIDEADEQVFIIFLEVINATNINKVNVGRKTSIGRIKDDETTRIGFEFGSYEVTEPDPDDENQISDLVYLIREDNQKSEQTYSVDLTVGDPGANYKPATIETSNTNQSYDYSFGLVDQTKVNVLFPPTVDRIPFVFSLNPDLAVEGTETFRATSAQVTPSGDFPVFQTPTGANAFSTTLIHILDNDELIVGFEALNYTVSESDNTIEVCVLITNPLPTKDLDVTVTLSPSTIDGTAEAGSDFTRLRPFLSISLVFPSSPASPTAEPRRKCFDVTIADDDLVENIESFSLLLQEDRFASQTGAKITPNQTEIYILDNDAVTGDLVNDTIVGDPLFTVPIKVAESQLTAIGVESLQLCYEIHGEDNQWFNLVTDECTSVNALYSSRTQNLNVITKVGVKAVDSSDSCVRILVDIDQCSSSVNNVSLETGEEYSEDDVSVKRYSNRVRISVPNCADITLVMWVICQQHKMQDPDDPGTDIDVRLLKFVVMRGLNFGHREAHGLLGQFWDVPFDITPYRGTLRDGSSGSGHYIVNTTSRNQQVQRTFTGLLHHYSWEHVEEYCLYVGNRQGGPIHEIVEPNDWVIERNNAYKVSDAFSEENFGYGLFNEGRCSA